MAKGTDWLPPVVLMWSRRQVEAPHSSVYAEPVVAGAHSTYYGRRANTSDDPTAFRRSIRQIIPHIPEDRWGAHHAVAAVAVTWVHASCNARQWQKESCMYDLRLLQPCYTAWQVSMHRPHSAQHASITQTGLSLPTPLCLQATRQAADPRAVRPPSPGPRHAGYARGAQIQGVALNSRAWHAPARAALRGHHPQGVRPGERREKGSSGEA